MRRVGTGPGRRKCSVNISHWHKGRGFPGGSLTHLLVHESQVRSLGGEDPLEQEMTTHGNPLQYSCLEDPMDRGACRGYSPRVAKSQTRLSPHAHLRCYHASATLK